MLLLQGQGSAAVSDYQSLHIRIHRIRIRLPTEPASVLPDRPAADWQVPIVQLAAVLQPVADAFAAAAAFAFAFAFAAFAAFAASAAVVEHPGQLVAGKQEPAAQQHRVVPASYPHSG